MYTIDRKKSGYVLTFSGNINADEMQKWFNESQKKLSTEFSKSFGVIIDMKDLEPLLSEAKTIMVNGQKLYKDKGMDRSAVILNDTKVCLQFKSLAIISGIFKTEKYIDSTVISNPIETAIKWVNEGIDPDK